MKPLIMIIGGGRFQTELIKRVAASGYGTLVTDILPDPPGREYADIFIQIDTNDREGLLAIAKEREVAAVFSDQTDRVVPVVAYLNAEMGLRGVDPETAEKFTDKDLMSRMLEDATAVWVPRSRMVQGPAEVRALGEEIGYPLLLKPKRSQSSKGVAVARCPEQVDLALSRAEAFAEDGGVLAQEFVEGREISVEGFCLRGEYVLLGVGDKQMYTDNPWVTKRITYPAQIRDSELQAVGTAAREVMVKLGLHTGLNNCEFRIRDGKPYLLEAAARGSGSNITALITSHISGVDIYPLLLDYITGRKIELPDVMNRAGMIEWFDFKSGKVRGIRGVEEVLDLSATADLLLNVEPGDVLAPPTDGTKRPGYFIVLGETREEAERKADTVRGMIEVAYA